MPREDLFGAKLEPGQGARSRSRFRFRSRSPVTATVTQPEDVVAADGLSKRRESHHVGPQPTRPQEAFPGAEVTRALVGVTVTGDRDRAP